ncbi:uncharacterized protein [Macrobrachium rosenbergii]|uniref:uncharacterized protein isoform X1 n=1 Tax=Macrobrachium rosenbergii TaxID=79674 RepID=UPI0034D62765
MTRKYLLCLFFLFGSRSLGVNSTGEGSTNPSVKRDDGCGAEKTVTGGTMVVKRYSQEEREEISEHLEQVRLYCKPDDGFQGIQIEVNGKVFYRNMVNFTAEELGIFPDSRWYDINVTFSYRAGILLWEWYLNVSVKDGGEKGKLFNTATAALSVTTMSIYSIGPAEWRFSQPAAHCYDQTGQNTISTDESESLTQSLFILLIVLGVASAITISVTIAVACKSKHTRAAVPPQANPGAGSSGSVQTENAIYGYRRY